MEGKGLPPSNPVIRKIYFIMLGHEVKMSHITRNAVIVLYVLLECLKWISTLLSLAIVAYP